MLRRTPLARSCLPLRRTTLRQRAKFKPPSVLHPNKRVPLTPVRWHLLKIHLFNRSGGVCEAWKGSELCLTPITWYNFEPHHIQSRAKGGPDALENLLAVCHACHRQHHGEPQWSKRKQT